MSKFVWGTLLILTFTSATAGAADEWQFGSASSFSSGRYGTDSRTAVLHTPITARRLFDDGDVTLVFPFTCISGDGGVTVVDGSPVRNERGGTSGASRDGSLRTGTGSTALDSGTEGPTEATHCGIGDVVVRGRYYVLDERGWLPTIAVRAHVKAPTASSARGLGTGRPDEGVGLEVSRTIGGGLLAMVDGGYTLIGDPSGVDYNNNWWYDVGVGRDLANGLLNVSVFFAEDRAIVSGLANARDILTAVTVRGPNGWRLQVSGQVGMSDGAPERGVTLGASRRF
jgi:hypothetical protein